MLCDSEHSLVLKDILRHSCLIAVTRPSDRYHTSASAAFYRHTWRFINLLIIIIIVVVVVVVVVEKHYDSVQCSLGGGIKTQKHVL